MDLEVFENGKIKATLSNASVNVVKGAALVNGTWPGLFPFTSVSDQTIAFELKGASHLITNAWISKVSGGPINALIEIKGISIK